MPWARKMYRNGKVWAEVDENGELVSSRGVTKIRYRQDDQREYSARTKDVAPVDEEALRAAKARRTKQRSKAAKAKQDSRAPSADDCDAEFVLIHTDGACFGNPGPAGIGVRMEWRGQVKEISRYLGEGTNNIAELTAIEVALQSVKRRRLPVRLYTDSAYSIGVLIGGWKAKANRELIERVRALMEEFSDLELRKVRGHAGDPHNERVDQLARDAIDRR